MGVPSVELFCIDITLDSGFRDFFKWCKAHDVPVVIVSR